ncbi:DUF305 domain-containing protein [Mycobacterium talmoniae]|nr:MULTISPECIES: DUF305 domain-containing protein [Mycobacterium]OHV05996.1 DUF305 domain-containing protein [Mycobacterium talmoniae]TDH56759.1 DUF305 domain-containing protein [Mycobacterium eburneum]
MSSIIARLAAVVVTLATAGVVAACGSHAEHRTDSASTTATSSAPAHNADDVAFLQTMIPHHQQAVQLAAMAPTRTSNAQLTALAAKISDQQQAEIQGFRAQLIQWDLTPGAQPGAPMGGMVDPATLDKLQTLSGAEFDTLWLQSMIAHHRGAITMAQTELSHGQSTDVIAVAHAIVTSQQAEVDQMNQMLGG